MLAFNKNTRAIQVLIDSVKEKKHDNFFIDYAKFAKKINKQEKTVIIEEIKPIPFQTKKIELAY